MALQVQLDATLTGGPAEQTDNLFPSGNVTIAFGLTPNNKQYNVSAGNVVTIASPAPAFQAVSGIGTGQTVTQAHTLFCRSSSSMILQLTFANPAGGADIVTTEPLNGSKLAEYPSNGYLKALAVQGQGQFEFVAFGNQ